MEYDLDKFMQDCDLFKEKGSILVKRAKAVVESENSKLKEELQKCELECAELNGIIARLIVEQKQSREKEKFLEEELRKSKLKREELAQEQRGIQEMHEKLREENIALVNEKSKLLSENEGIKKKNSELERGFWILHLRVQKMGEVVESAVCNKVAELETDNALEQKPSVADEVKKDLKRKLLEADATHTVNKSWQKKLEANEARELTESRAGMKVVTRNANCTSCDLALGVNAPPVTGANGGNGCEQPKVLDNECKGLQISGCSTTQACSSHIIEIGDSNNESDKLPLSRMFGGLQDKDQI